MQGLRIEKYSALQKMSIHTTSWNVISPAKTHFFFVPKDFSLEPEYTKFTSLKDIFHILGSGVKTERDKVSIHFDRLGIEESVHDFQSLDDFILLNKYSLGQDSRDWKVSNARADLLTNKDRNSFHPILYRPFDIRQTWYSGKSRGFIGTPGAKTMRHLLSNNIALIAKRQANENSDYTWFCVSNTLVIDGSFAIDNKGRESVFPLYCLDENDENNQQSIIKSKRTTNFKSEFLTKIEQNLGYLPTPEAIFYYIYAIFHSPSYRSRYAEFLKIDFPRVPRVNASKQDLFRSRATKIGD